MLPLLSAAALLAASLVAKTPQTAGVSAAHPAPARRPPAAAAEELRRSDQPAEAQAFFLQKRLRANETTLPFDRYLVARAQMATMRQYSSRTKAWLPPRSQPAAPAAAAAAWTPLGPGNVGGRTLALLFEPDDARILYAGTADGGIWKTSDGGGSWNPVGDMLPTLAVSTLVMDPKHFNVLYAGTGEGAFNGDAVRGAGIFQTGDAGQTWTQMPGTDTADFYYVNKLVLSPASGNLYAATGTGVWRYDFARAAWSELLAPGTFLGCFDLALRVDAAQNEVAFAACGSFLQGAVFQNPTAQVAGSPWQVVLTNAAMGRTSLAMAPSNPEVIYALVASNANGPHQGYNQGLLGVWRSTAGGGPGTWQPRLLNKSRDVVSTLLLTNPIYAVLQTCGFGGDEFFNQGWYDTVIAVDPTDPDRVWAGGIDLFRSDDGGQTFGAASYWWAQPDPSYSHADQHALAFPPGYDGAANQQLFIGNDGGVFLTRNSLAQTAAHSTALLCNDANSKVVFESLNNGFAATQFYDGAVFPDGTTYFGGTQDNGTVGGDDKHGPNAWSTLLGGDGGFVAVDPQAPNVLYATNTGLSLQKSTDGGALFVDATRGIADFNFLFIAPFILDPTDPQRLWTGGSYLWRTTNGAANWSRASARIAGSLGAAISAIASSPVDPQHVLIGTDEGVIQYSGAALAANGNTSWPHVKPRVGYLSWLAWDPAAANTAYATYSTFGGTHVWKTTDGGASWTGLDGSGANALPDLPANSIVVDPASGNLYVGTDMGVFVSLDGGQSWALELTGFPDTVTDALVMYVGPGGSRSLFAFTHGRGAWKVGL
jgi:hypothetical protein